MKIIMGRWGLLPVAFDPYAFKTDDLKVLYHWNCTLRSNGLALLGSAVPPAAAKFAPCLKLADILCRYGSTNGSPIELAALQVCNL